MNSAPPNPPNKDPHKRKKVIAVLSISLLLIGIIVWLIWWLFFSFYESTDDAYVGGNLIQISSRQKGTVIALFADDTELVEEGQLLIRLDPTDYAIAFDIQKAALALAARQVQTLWDEVEVRHATLTSTEAKLDFAKQQYTDRKGLIESSAISVEEFEQYRTGNDTSQADYEVAKAQLQEALNSRGYTSKEAHPQIVNAKLQLINAYIVLQRCFIYAPRAGFIGQRTVQIGQNIEADLPLMSVVPLNEIWVDANFKETQLANVRIGQHAEVTADIYGGGHKIRGKVIGFHPGTGTIFSLLPAQNATGNWIKIVQRLPVRIALSCEDMKNFPLFLGLSTNVEIDTRDSGLKLSTIPSTQQIAGTDIYDVPLDPVFPIIEQILKENFKQ